MSDALCLTPDGREKVRETCEAVPAAPWTAYPDDLALGRYPYISIDTPQGSIIDVMTRARMPFTGEERDVDYRAVAEFIAMARTELPAALDRIEKLESALRYYAVQMGAVKLAQDILADTGREP